MIKNSMASRRVLFLNSLDERYGSTYRLHALRKSLAGLAGVTSELSQVNASALHKLGTALNASFGPYDVLVTQKFNPITLSALLVAALRGKPRLVDWDDLDVGLQGGRLKKSIARVCEAFGPRLANIVTTHSPAIRKRLERLRVPCAYVPQGFDAALFRPDPKVRAQARKELGFGDSDRVVGHICTLTTGGAAHLETILAAWAGIEDSRVRFLLIGGGPLDRWANRLLATYRLSDRVIRTGLVPQERAAGLLQSLDVGVVYMGDSDADRARVSFKVIEYLALNIPVIGRVSGETQRLFGPWIERCERENFAGTIRSVLERSAKRNTMAEVEQYSWDRVTAPFRDAVLDLCSGT